MHWELGVGNVAALEIDKVSGVIEFTFWWVRQTIKKTSSQRHKEISDDNVGHKGYNEVMWKGEGSATLDSCPAKAFLKR